jgi:epoxyqueuosine reductase QueG
VSDTIRAHGIELFGFCSLDDVLPLLPCRAVARVPLHAQTVVVCAFPYLVREPEGVHRNVSYYACVPDYHRVAMDTLSGLSASLREEYPQYRFEPFVDSSPIREVRAAQLAGLGCVGMNGLLTTEEYGSYVFLGEVVTDMPLETSSHRRECLGCGLCQRECPTGSIRGGTVCRETCLSAVTQRKGELSPSEVALMVEHRTAWGCDVCQTVCPMNRNARETYVREFREGFKPVLTEENLTEDGAYYWRGRKTILRNVEAIADA